MIEHWKKNALEKTVRQEYNMVAESLTVIKAINTVAIGPLDLSPLWSLQTHRMILTRMRRLGTEIIEGYRRRWSHKDGHVSWKGAVIVGRHHGEDYEWMNEMQDDWGLTIGGTVIVVAVAAAFILQ
jgi:hypothetical protein